jgi:hypothetical protein
MDMTQTQEYLIDRYGPLMSIRQVAELLHRAPTSLAAQLTTRARQKDPWIKHLREASVKIGRRRLFRSMAIADLADGVCDMEEVGK